MMKMLYFLTLPLFFIGITTGNITALATVNTPDEVIIEEHEEDIVGNGIKETIQLYGTLLSPDSTYYRDTYAVIKTKNNKEWKLHYEGGYEPKIEFYDLTHNGINDILYQKKTKSNKDGYEYFLHTINKDRIKEIELPIQDIQGQFLDNFQVELSINAGAKPLIIDLNDRMEEYERLNIYNKEGHLLDSRSLMIEPITLLKPILISTDKGYGLKSNQQINGVHSADQLGIVETTWYKENDKWIILQTDWKPREK